MVAAGERDEATPARRRLNRFNSTPTGTSIERPDNPETSDLEQTVMVCYRSVGLGLWGAVLRFAGMPLEKIALFMNSSQVSGSGQLGQALRLTFAEGALAPYRVVGPASINAWFFQYAAMGLVFQSVDNYLSSLLGVPRAVYGAQLMEPPGVETPPTPAESIRRVGKMALAPVLSGSIESAIANRAEVQRYFGLKRFAELPPQTSPISRAAGHAFGVNAARNTTMCATSFVVTPALYRLLLPQERKSQSSLFWFGLGVNIFFGNVIAINLQALWGRSLDRLATHGAVDYGATVREGLRKEGVAAFITPSKWFSRVLMNAPAQGTLVRARPAAPARDAPARVPRHRGVALARAPVPCCLPPAASGSS